jgi:putative transposase
VIGDDGAVEIAVPRDRNGSFEPQIVPKGQTRLEGFDDRVISLYARGLSVREIQGHLQELYGVEVSPDLISRVTDAVLEEEVRDWQFDALRVKIRDEGLVRNKESMSGTVNLVGRASRMHAMAVRIRNL